VPLSASRLDTGISANTETEANKLCADTLVALRSVDTHTCAFVLGLAFICFELSALCSDSGDLTPYPHSTNGDSA
jgi:hypothetical protein